MTAHHICEYLAQATFAPHLRNGGPLFICEHRRWSAAEAWQRVVHLALQLEKECNVQVGDRVCILGLATPSTLESVLAITALGAIAAPLNTRWTANEITQGIDTIQASTLLVTSSSSSSGSSDSTNTSTNSLDIALKAASLSASIHTVAVLIEDEDSIQNKLQPRQQQQRRQNIILLRQNSKTSTTPSTTPTTMNFTLNHAPEDAACIIFTSGTTGPPKAAVLSHSALHFQCQQKLQICGYSKKDIYLHTSPLYHVGGLCSALAMVMVGAQHVFLPTFTAQNALRAIVQYRVTSFIAVPTLIADILLVAASGKNTVAGSATKTTKTLVLPSVTTILIGAGGVHPTLLHQCISLFPNATLYSAYGMTEGTSSLTFTTLHTPPTSTSITSTTTNIKKQPPPPPLLPSTIQGGVAAAAAAAVYVGQPPPGIELAILPLPSAVSILKKGSGEVVTRGPHVMNKYYNNADATCTAFLPGVWLRTGDIGYIEYTLLDTTTNCTSSTNDTTISGRPHVWLIGRAKDVVKTGGENVNAAEVERTLLHHPAIRAVCVVGVPDVRLGEVVAAVVVINNDDDDGGVVVGKTKWRWRGNTLQILLPTAGSGSTGTRISTKDTVEEGCVDVDGYILQQYCRQQGLAGFKIPRVLMAVEQLPVNSTGKVVKPEVKAVVVNAMNNLNGNITGKPVVRSRL